MGGPPYRAASAASRPFRSPIRILAPLATASSPPRA